MPPSSFVWIFCKDHFPWIFEIICGVLACPSTWQIAFDSIYFMYFAYDVNLLFRTFQLHLTSLFARTFTLSNCLTIRSWWPSGLWILSFYALSLMWTFYIFFWSANVGYLFIFKNIGPFHSSTVKMISIIYYFHAANRRFLDSKLQSLAPTSSDIDSFPKILLQAMESRDMQKRSLWSFIMRIILFLVLFNFKCWGYII